MKHIQFLGQAKFGFLIHFQMNEKKTSIETQCKYLLCLKNMSYYEGQMLAGVFN